MSRFVGLGHLDVRREGFLQLNPVTYNKTISDPAKTYYSLIPLNLHDNATEAYPSVNPNPNAWEFLQNIGYYQYGAYFNISEFWDRVITCAMSRHYQEGEQRTFYFPTNDAFRGNIKGYHVHATTILQNIVEALVFRLSKFQLPDNQSYRTMALGKGYPFLVARDYNRTSYCWYDLRRGPASCTPHSKIQIFHTAIHSCTEPIFLLTLRI
uniref:Uncharacterized protein n=1 Tax=Glossina palpalis gambiensis TaxID=67801 RepID=A0A1B0C6D2_9MUSC